MIKWAQIKKFIPKLISDSYNLFIKVLFKSKMIIIKNKYID